MDPNSQELFLGWRKILKLKEYVRSFFKWQITGGSKVPLWVDNWHPQGVLKVKYSTRFIYEIGSHHIALVSSVLENDE